MFAVITRAAARRAVVGNAVRYASTKPPQQPSPSKEPETPTGTSEPAPEAPLEPLRTSDVPSLDFSPPEPKEEMHRTGAKSSRDTLTSSEKKRRLMGRAALAALLMGLGVNTIYMGREWDMDELKEKKMTLENAPSTRWGRTKERFTELFDYFNKPAWPELLPPPLPPHMQKPYTLIISLDDLLVTSAWDRKHGWRTAKRPGVDYFLAYISQFYEVVVFTTQNFYTAGPILDQLDKYNFFVSHRLFREATRSLDGRVVKDLSYLNRDLSKVVMMDTDPDHVSTHPENSIVIPKWNGDPRDNGLVAMIPFLESIAIYKPADVRPILEAYHGKNIPLEYAKKEAEAKAKHVEEWKKKKGIRTSSFTSLFGLSSSPSPLSNSDIPPTYLEQKRREAQFNYIEEQKYIAAHKDEFERLLKQEQEAMAKEAPNSLFEAFGQFTGAKKDAQAADPNVPVHVLGAPPQQPDAPTSPSPARS